MKNFIFLSIILIFLYIVPLSTNADDVDKLAPCNFEIDFDTQVKLHFTRNGKDYKTTPDDGYYVRGEKTILLVVGFCAVVQPAKLDDYTSYLPPLLLSAYKTHTNLIILEYSALCCDYYRFIGETMWSMGRYVVERLIDLGLRPEMIIGVGHSVGAHIFPPITTAFEQRNLGKLFMVWGICPGTDGFVTQPYYEGLNPQSADTVVHVYTDNLPNVEFIARGTINYFVNSGCEFQPNCSDTGCNHFACLTVVALAFQPSIIENNDAFVGRKCYQEIAGCISSDETSKLSPTSGEQTGCYCPNVDKEAPYYKSPSDQVCKDDKAFEYSDTPSNSQSGGLLGGLLDWLLG